MRHTISSKTVLHDLAEGHLAAWQKFHLKAKNPNWQDHCHCEANHAPGLAVGVSPGAGDKRRRTARPFCLCREALMRRDSLAASTSTSSPSRAAPDLAMKPIIRLALIAKPPPSASTTKGKKRNPCCAIYRPGSC